MAIQTLQKGYGGVAEYEYLASAARTATPTVDDIVVPYGKALTVVIDITAGAATPAVTPAIVGVTDTDIVYTVLTGAQIVSTSAAVVVMRVGAGITDVSNLGSSIPLPKKFRVSMTHADSDSLTYSVNLAVR